MDATKAGTQNVADIASRLMRPDTELPVSSAFFMGIKTAIADAKLAPKRVAEDKYSINVYRIPVPIDKVIAFGSQNISPAHQGGIRWAVDFYVPEGTLIRAPCPGWILEIVQKFDGHGTTIDYWAKGNGIFIMGSKGEYLWLEHLQHKFAKDLKLHVGQKMGSDELVGISGNTGITEKPHVHMEVLEYVGSRFLFYERLGYQNYLTKKIRFDTKDIPFDLYVKEKELLLQKQP